MSGNRVAWIRRLSSNSFGRSVAADGAGNIFLGGVHAGAIDLGGGQISHSGGSDAFIAKYASDSTYIWSKTFGGDDKQTTTGVAVDGTGNLVVLGTFIGSIEIDGTVLTNPAGIGQYLAKFDTCGQLLWARSTEGYLESIDGDLALDGKGNIVVTGGFYNHIDLGGGSYTGQGGSDIFVAKYRPDGEHLWSKAFGSAVGGEQGHAVAVDGGGNIVVTGILTGAVNFGGGIVGSTGSGDVFVAKFDPDGGHVWAETYGDNSWSPMSDGRIALPFASRVLIAASERTTGVPSGSLSQPDDPSTARSARVR